MKLNYPFFLTLTWICMLCLPAQASVDTVATFSRAMQKEIKAVVITPEDYTQSKDYPVVYLLHGYSGNYKNWIEKVPQLEAYADQYDMIIVTPDG
ncbi:MAG: alpha/beta hydrolase-fold protein, partial [Algoriphagus sp.]